ncbi:MAG: ASKHA domain-containing protein [Gemmatimonadota bacterium]|nr:ASKHA domain-containing protein [Gemmatimonadota bacterium]
MRVTFLPDGRTFAAAGPMLVSEAAAHCDLPLEHPCGTRGRCTKCRIRFLEGAPPETPADVERLSGTLRADGWRLSCRAVVEGAAVVEIPAASRAAASKSFGPAVLRRGSRAASAGVGIAVDLGSTTVAAALVDRATTRVLAHASALNRQVAHGGDVISRIRFAMDHDDGDARLTRALRDTVAELVDGLLGESGVPTRDVVAVTACGNGAMTHSFVGESIRSLGEAPYHGSFTEPAEVPAADVGLTLHPDARARVFPQVASHIGGDTVAAVLATRMHRARRPELLVDLGTNTEIVLATPDGMEAASAAAGPAFEGAEITQGMRATRGAVDRVSLALDGGLLVHTVGGVDPEGICGTGLVDATATLLELGVVEPGGRMRPPGEAPVGLARAHASRMEAGERGNHRFLITDTVALHALDVRQLQLVKGSIMAAMHLLLARAGLGAADLRAVHVAGAFGTHLRKSTALRVGLLPPIDPERIRMVGDAAAAGARMALCDEEAWTLAGRTASGIRHVELATDPGYTDAFASAIPFPGGEEIP